MVNISCRKSEYSELARFSSVFVLLNCQEVTEGQTETVFRTIISTHRHRVWCCILHGPAGEHIVDIVPGGTELALQ